MTPQVTVNSDSRTVAVTVLPVSIATTDGAIVGPASSTDNAIVRFNLTSGQLAQNSDITVSDAVTATANAVQIANAHAGQTNSALVLTPKGTGAVVFGAVPTGSSTTGNARGANSFDGQTLRASATQVASGIAATAFGTRNVASGNYSSALGYNNTASGAYGVSIGGINGASASGAVAIGYGSNSTGSYAVAIGPSNTASGYRSTALGYSAVAYRRGSEIFASGLFSTAGDGQVGRVVYCAETTDDTETVLTIDGAAIDTISDIYNTNFFVLQNNTSTMADVYVVARCSDPTKSACYHRRCLITRWGDSASTALVSTAQTIGTDIETDGAWDVNLTANTTYGSLDVKVTGASATTIRWVAEITWREVIH